MGFRKSLALKVHRRLHNGEDKYPCSEDGCEKKFISKKLLLKHVQRHYEPPPPPPSPPKPKEPTPEPVAAPPAEDIKPKEEPNEKEMKVKDEGDSKIKTEIKEENGEKSKSNEETPRKKKKKRSKDDAEKSMVDLMNLPALNLSESDSSDDSDADHSNASSRRFPSAPGTTKGDHSGDEAGDKSEPKKEELKVEKEDEDGPEKLGSEEIVNIWNNFKNYQASRGNSRRPSLSEEITEEQFVEKMLRSKVLHVSQSDHDYCMMFKKVYPEVKASEVGETIVIDDDGNMEKETQQESLLKGSSRMGSPSKKQKSPRKQKVSKSGSDSSSSDSGSDSDSSCECGSNCSCSSSSSGSSSSSSDDSDSSDENNPKKKDKKKRAGEQQVAKVEEPIIPVQEEPPAEPPEPIDPDTVIHESDLETDESETDEEFYDEHPQKMASQLLAEKRRQLMQQTCMSPMNQYGIVENSRPSTPSLPEEMVAKKKVKLKKRKRERKLTKKTPPPPLLQEPVQNIPPALNFSHVDQFSPAPIPVTTPLTAPPILHSVESPMIPTASSACQDSPFSPASAAPKTPRLSTGNSSESDAPLKRSQRSRKPNKFYGYTSDDEIPPGLTPILSKNPEKSILSVMKPTPPPNLVWSKEDLPSPPKVKSSKTKPIDPSTPLSSRAAPPAAAPTQHPVPLQQPPRVDTTRIPNVPVHHVIPSPLATPLHNDADSDSSQEGALQISQKPAKSTPLRSAPPLPKLKLSVPKKAASRATPKTPAARKRAPPKSKTPKSAPPVPSTAAQNPPAFPPTSAPATTAIASPFQPPIVDPAAPKVPPLGSFPSIRQSEFFPANQIRIPAGWRPPREGESVYCYCRCPYDEVSEMIACDGDNCRIEWFHFECVGIIMPPKGKWFCPECKLKQQQPGGAAAQIAAQAELQDELMDSN